VCECGAVENKCVANGCTTDASCGEGGACSPSPATCAEQSAIATGPSDGFPHYCHTTSDQCLDDMDCAGKGICAYSAGALTWRCSGVPCQ
jgi:hypothetical protein